jgi:hypothetical protein
MDLSYFDKSACTERRARLAVSLGKHPALIASGAPRPRGSHRGLYPFRSASHFLYLFGLHLPKAMGLWNGEDWHLYLPEPAPDADLWTGPEPGFDALAEIVGMPVLPMPRLADALHYKSVATL